MRREPCIDGLRPFDEQDCGIGFRKRLNAYLCSESTCNGSRLVTKTFAFGVSARSEDTIGAASTICSKLSIRISNRFPATKSASSPSAPIARAYCAPHDRRITYR